MARGTTHGNSEAQHGTAGFHGRRPARWAESLRQLEPPPPPAPPPVKHCWYDGPYGRQAALLLGWSNPIDGHRRGRVAVAIPDGSGWTIVEMWVEQEMLNPT